ncbi:GTP 3',8-cyclase MoaA [Corynebacterium sp. 3HC-13]|uniref:GTP 3',8-cyclase MoaA n=1 Tax=Corynebacterium poyangense TaxID=2684405 RepID=UPI001CCA1AAE|nr:GTP 3',8-cyclase MoaA [Corynebacterium poyangense]MBZ8177071.1 GTP 3',8-cyclase MoaA [Corynebacterium poyangense]
MRIPLSDPVVSATAAATDLPRALPHGNRLLYDRFGRVARDLRVSLTDRCNLRCTYCMPEEGLTWLAKESTLNDDEIQRLLRIAITRLGIRQVRFTGGEPLLRKSLAQIIRTTKELMTDENVPPRIAMTTNGVGLANHAASLAKAGLDRVNISLDTIDPQRYHQLTRRDRLHHVIDAIDASVQAGLTPVKINAVIMPGLNEQDIVPLAEFCLQREVQLRFIEQMPLGPHEAWDRSTMISARDIIQRLSESFVLSPAVEKRGSAPAALWDVHHRDRDLAGKIGIIASVSQSFCTDCDRTRLTADGAVRNCLFTRSETSLRDILRDGGSDEDIMLAWATAMWHKKPGHGIDDPHFLQPQRPMSAIGG